MIVTIDTHKDDKQEIQKAIKLLQALIGEHIGEQVHTNANMFENTNPALQEAQPDMGSAFGSFFDNAGKQEPIKKTLRKVELY